MACSLSDKRQLCNLLFTYLYLFTGGVGEWIAGFKENVLKLTAAKECSMEYVLSAGASLLQEFCVLNWLGPAEKDAANERFGWKAEKAEWVSSNSVVSVVYDFYNY